MIKTNRTKPSDNMYAIGPYNLSENALGSSLNITKDIETLTADKTLVKADSGKVFSLNKVDGLTVNLPSISSSDAGLSYSFVVMTNLTSNNYVITAQSGDFLKGYVFSSEATDYVANLKYFAPNGTSNIKTTMNNTTTGGKIGSKLTFTVNDDGFWFVTGTIFGSNALATPFSD